MAGDGAGPENRVRRSPSRGSSILPSSALAHGVQGVNGRHTGLWSRRRWVRIPLGALSMGLVTGETKRL
jgi:hypothetical protein